MAANDDSVHPIGKALPYKGTRIISTKRALDYLNAIEYLAVTEQSSRYKTLRRIQSTLLKFIVYVYYPISFGVCLHVALKTDLGFFLVPFQASFNTYGCTLKALCCHLMLPRLWKVNGILDKLDARCKDRDEVEEQLRAVRIGRLVMRILVVLYYGYITTTYVAVILNGRPPCSARLPGLDWRRSEFELHLNQAIEMFIIYIMIAQQIFNDGYAAVYIHLLGSHVRILLLRVSKLGKRKDLTPKEHTEALKACIQDYQLLLEFRNLVFPLISKTIFIQYIAMAACCATTLINVVFISTNSYDTIGSIVYIIAVASQCFPTCYFATQLEVDSGRLSTEIFGSEWLHQSREYRLMVLNFMQQLQQDVRFSAAKVFEISLQMFIVVAKFSFSLYTFMETMDLEARFDALSGGSS